MSPTPFSKFFITFWSTVVDINAFISLCETNGIQCGRAEAEKLSEFADFLLSENEKYNLTAIREPRALMLRHLCDSLTLLKYVPENARVLDIGSGAGFPSVPLAVCRPDVTVTALDSTAKKISFISASASKLGLSNLTAISARAEELAHDHAYRGAFDIVTARAVSRTSVLTELAAAYIREGGCLLAMKGEPDTTAAELSDAAAIARRVGLSHERTVSLSLHDETESLARTIVIMKKTGSTPASYPRRYSQIIKN